MKAKRFEQEKKEQSALSKAVNEVRCVNASPSSIVRSLFSPYF